MCECVYVQSRHIFRNLVSPYTLELLSQGFEEAIIAAVGGQHNIQKNLWIAYNFPSPVICGFFKQDEKWSRLCVIV